MGHIYMLNVYLMPWFLAHGKRTNNIFPDEISAASGAYYDSYGA